VNEYRESFEALGFFVAPQIFTPAECRLVVEHERRRNFKHAGLWHKARATVDLFYRRIVWDARFLSLLRPILGENLIQWGADIIDRTPGAIHPWHCDIESCAPEGGFVSIWIGLCHTSSRSALSLVTRSHAFGTTIQEQAYRHRFRRGQASDVDVLNWARKLDPAATLVVPRLRNGDALVFDGRLWHGSNNTQRYFSRTALLLQYARADRRVRMYDPAHLEWPLRTRQDRLPPVIVVSGVAPPGLNDVVAVSAPV
jgi:ectoine hydroxylase-related dioxygenase (phytanoyl-CoA dioxygenase family)